MSTLVLLIGLSFWIGCGEDSVSSGERNQQKFVIDHITYLGQSPRTSEILMFDLAVQLKENPIRSVIEVKVVGEGETIKRLIVGPHMVALNQDYNRLSSIHFGVEFDFIKTLGGQKEGLINLEFRICKPDNDCGNACMISLLVR